MMHIIYIEDYLKHCFDWWSANMSMLMLDACHKFGRSLCSPKLNLHFSLSNLILNRQKSRSCLQWYSGERSCSPGSSNASENLNMTWFPSSHGGWSAENYLITTKEMTSFIWVIIPLNFQTMEYLKGFFLFLITVHSLSFKVVILLRAWWGQMLCELLVCCGVLNLGVEAGWPPKESLWLCIRAIFFGSNVVLSDISMQT